MCTAEQVLADERKLMNYLYKKHFHFKEANILQLCLISEILILGMGIQQTWRLMKSEV